MSDDRKRHEAVSADRTHRRLSGRRLGRVVDALSGRVRARASEKVGPKGLAGKVYQKRKKEVCRATVLPGGDPADVTCCSARI